MTITDLNGHQSDVLFKVTFEDGTIETHCAECVAIFIVEIPEHFVKIEKIKE